VPHTQTDIHTRNPQYQIHCSIGTAVLRSSADDNKQIHHRAQLTGELSQLCTQQLNQKQYIYGMVWYARV